MHMEEIDSAVTAIPLLKHFAIKTMVVKKSDCFDMHVKMVHTNDNPQCLRSFQGQVCGD